MKTTLKALILACFASTASAQDLSHLSGGPSDRNAMLRHEFYHGRSLTRANPYAYGPPGYAFPGNPTVNFGYTYGTYQVGPIYVPPRLRGW